jgi:hypothetical protein
MRSAGENSCCFPQKASSAHRIAAARDPRRKENAAAQKQEGGIPVAAVLTLRSGSYFRTAGYSAMCK